jgi:hypothetical protein
MFKDSDTLFFMHVPKTAGISLVSWLTQFFAERECDLYLNSPRPAAGSRLITGHIGIDGVAQLGQSPKVITWLREPAERLLSSYRYLRQLAAKHQTLDDIYAFRQQEAAAALTFDEWVRLSPDDYCHHNLMAHMLAGPHCWGDYVLPTALNNLMALDHVGLVERMQDSIDLLCYKFAWLPARFDVRLNVTVELFNLRWQTMLHSMGFRPSIVIVPENNLLGRAAPGVPGFGPADRAVLHERLEKYFRIVRSGLSEPDYGPVSLAEPIFGRNWTSPVGGSNSNPVRWIGPEPTAELFVSLPKDADIALEFVVQSAMSADLLPSLRLTANGRDLPLVLTSGEPAVFPQQVRTVIPVNVLRAQPGMVKLEFHLKETIPEPVPSEPEKGPKRLGIAVEKLIFHKETKSDPVVPASRPSVGNTMDYADTLMAAR